MHLTPTFKQAVENGIAWRGSIAYTDWHEDRVASEGWVTERFGVIDDLRAIGADPRHVVGEGYTITHLETGTVVWGFKCHHVALNFMLELEAVMPHIDLAVRANQAELKCYLRERGAHPSQSVKLKAA